MESRDPGDRAYLPTRKTHLAATALPAAWPSPALEPHAQTRSKSWLLNYSFCVFSPMCTLKPSQDVREALLRTRRYAKRPQETNLETVQNLGQSVRKKQHQLIYCFCSTRIKSRLQGSDPPNLLNLHNLKPSRTQNCVTEQRVFSCPQDKPLPLIEKVMSIWLSLDHLRALDLEEMLPHNGATVAILISLPNSGDWWLFPDDVEIRG